MATETLGARILWAADVHAQHYADWMEDDSEADASGPLFQRQRGSCEALRALAARADAAERLADDAAAFVERLLAVHEDGRYRLVWELAQNHMGPYQGPFYTAELDKLIATLAAWRALGEVQS